MKSEFEKLARKMPALKQRPPNTAIFRAPTRPMIVPATLYIVASITMLMVATSDVSVRDQWNSRSSAGTNTLQA